MKKHLYYCLAAAMLLTGCANSSKEDNSKNDAEDITAQTTAVTEAVTTAEETAPVTTTAAPETTTTATTTEPRPDPKPEEVVLTGKKQVEVYSKTRVKDFITETNGELVSPDELLNTEKPGSYEVKVQVKYEGYTYEKAIKYEVSDTTAPVVLNAGVNTVVPVGAAFDLGSYVGYGDNFDREPELTYEGEVDTSTEGVYPITAHVTDDNGNVQSWTLNITVSDSEQGTPDEDDELGENAAAADTEITPTIYFDDFVSQYSGENTKFGIDVSHWQGDIDFEAVKNAGCDFVIVRLGFYDDDLLGVDEKYLDNIQNAKDAGLEVGVYYYSTDYDEASLREHAKWIKDMIDGTELDFPVVFDWESFMNYQDYSMSIHDLNKLYDAFADEMKKGGYDTMLYSSKNFLEKFWEYPDDRTVWLAHYEDETDYAGKYVMWQRCGTGRIDGVATDVDLDVYYVPKTEKKDDSKAESSDSEAGEETEEAAE